MQTGSEVYSDSDSISKKKERTFPFATKNEHSKNENFMEKSKQSDDQMYSLESML